MKIKALIVIHNYNVKYQVILPNIWCTKKNPC